MIVRSFKRELSNERGPKGMVLVADCSEYAPALYDADKYFIVPKIDEEGYIEEVLDICRTHNVRMILSLIDPELSLLAKHKGDFLLVGTVPIISDYDVVEMCFDKYILFQFLRDNGFGVVRNYVDLAEFLEDQKAGLIDYPVVVKPRKGSASINIQVALNPQEVESLFGRFDSLMIQEYIKGTEYGVDTYVDMMSGEPVAIFLKEKIKMKAGETDKSRSVKNKKLFGLVRQFLKKANLRGVVDIDVFESNGEYYIVDVNPRFGGGYPHAYECGVNFPRMILNNVCGKANEIRIGDYEEGVIMMKYHNVKIIGKALRHN